MKIRAILIIPNVPSLLVKNRKVDGGYKSFGYPVMVWELCECYGFEWMHPWDGFNTNYVYTTNHAKKSRVAHHLHMETGLPIIHIDKRRAAGLNQAKTMNVYDPLYIPFRKDDLCLK